jgi:hypothetical protein
VNVVRPHLRHPAVDVFLPGEALAEADLVVARVGVHEHLHAPRVEVIGEEAGAADVQEDVGGLGDLIEGLAGHAEAGLVQQRVVPLVLQVRRVGVEEVADEVDGVVRVVGRIALGGVERPDPRVLMVVDVVAQLGQAEDVMEVIPRDAAERELADHATDDDAEFLGVSH